MGASHQAGWVVPRGRYWYGYFRRRVLDPKTENERVDTICIRLDLKSHMTKAEARDALRAEINKQTGANPDSKPRRDSSVSFAWFVRSRYFPLREGDWRPETAKEKKSQIELDLIARFGEYPLDGLDRFTLQTHLNGLAERYSQDRVKQARSYLKSIFDEAIEQEFLVRDPSRKLKIPRNLRAKDKTVLSWEQLGKVLSRAGRRDRLILLLEMTDALRPSELFALRWRSFDNHNTLSITETVFRRKLRPFGKTVKSLGNVHLPDGLAAELLGWKAECPDPKPNAFIFAAENGGVMDIGNYRNRVLQPIADDLKLPKLNFQVLRRSTATQAQRLGSVKDIQAHLRHSRADTTANEYMQELPDSVKEMVGSVYDLLTKSEQAQADGGKSATKLLQRSTAERHGSPNLLPNATNSEGHAPASC